MNHPIDVSERAGVRSLHFGSDWVQGAMRINRPTMLELVYTREMMAGLLFAEPKDWPQRILIIGLGAGSLVRYIDRFLPNARMTVVEINPAVVGAAEYFFKLPKQGPRLRVVIDDGAHYLATCDREFDAILVDGFDADASPGELQGSPFYSTCRYRLRENGWLACNLFANAHGFAQTCQRITQAFDGQALILPPCESGNAVALARRGAPLELTHTTLQARMATLREDTLLDLERSLERLQTAHPDPIQL